MPPKASGPNGTVAVCPAVSKVERGSVLHYGMPSTAELIQMAKATLGML